MGLGPSQKASCIYKLPGTKGSLFGLKRVPRPLFLNKIVIIAVGNTTVVTYINMEGGMTSAPLSTLLWRILTWCSRKESEPQIQTRSRLAECDSRQAIQARPDHSNRVVSPSKGRPVDMQRFHQPQIDLFAKRFNNKLPQFV